MVISCHRFGSSWFFHMSTGSKRKTQPVWKNLCEWITRDNLDKTTPLVEKYSESHMWPKVHLKAEETQRTHMQWITIKYDHLASNAIYSLCPSMPSLVRLHVVFCGTFSCILCKSAFSKYSWFFFLFSWALLNLVYVWIFWVGLVLSSLKHLGTLLPYFFLKVFLVHNCVLCLDI